MASPVRTEFPPSPTPSTEAGTPSLVDPRLDAITQACLSASAEAGLASLAQFKIHPLTFQTAAALLRSKLETALLLGIPVLSQDSQIPSSELYKESIAALQQEIDSLAAAAENIEGAAEAIGTLQVLLNDLAEFPLELLAEMERGVRQSRAEIPHICKTETSTAKRFCPWNDWTVNENGPRYSDTGEPQWIIDDTTDAPYLNESKDLVRLKCFALIFGTVIQTIAAILKALLFLIVFATGLFSNDAICRYLWPDSPDDLGANFGKSFVKILAIPFYSTALAVTAVYGLFNPYDARKIYSGLESAYFDEWRLAPCFQPQATSHFFGSNISHQGGF